LLPTAPWKHVTTIIKHSEKLCREQSYPVMFPDPSLHGRTAERFIMTSCVHNDIVGLRNRYMKEPPTKFGPKHPELFQQAIDELVAALKPNFKGVKPLKDLLAKKRGKLRKRYDDAARNILDNGFHLEKHSKIKAFIKNEVYNECKPPRMIMGRDPRFFLAYAPLIDAIEEAMKHLPEISKGRNFAERGAQFFEKVLGDVIAGIDFRKFESTQSLELLANIELSIIFGLIEAGLFGRAIKLWVAKLKIEGYTLHDIYFMPFGLRCTGEADTGCFNTLITWVACRYCELVNKLGTRNFICDGDDNLMRIPLGANFVDTFAELGLDAKIEIFYDYHDVEYCSGRFIQITPGVFHYVQDPRKLMQNLPVFRKKKFEHCMGVYYHSLGYMYNVLYPNFPLYSNIGRFLMKMAPDRHISMEMLNEINPSHAEAFSNTKQKVSIDYDLVRVEIAMSFNYTLEEVRRYEAWYDEHLVVLPPENNKRYNAEKTPAVLLTDQQIDQVEQIISESVDKHVFTKSYHDYIIRPLLML